MFVKRKAILILIFFFISNCSNFKPVYKNNIENISLLQSFALTTDNKAISKNIKKSLLATLPTNKSNKYILKIEANSSSIGTVNDASRSISRYKIELDAIIKLYYRDKNYDKLLKVFKERHSSPYSLVSNNIRSTLASRNKAEKVAIRLLTESFYNRLIIYLSSKEHVN